jgi:hypothetical protein
MKKYLIVFIPLIVCSALAYFTQSITPTDYPHPAYPYRTPEMLNYLSNMWIIIGIVFSLLVFILLIIEDGFALVSKKIEERQLRKNK